MGVPFRWDHGMKPLRRSIACAVHRLFRFGHQPSEEGQARRIGRSASREGAGDRGVCDLQAGRRALAGIAGRDVSIVRHSVVLRTSECRMPALGLAHAVRVSGTPWPVHRVTPPVNPTRALDGLDHRRAALQ
jgi:hypothetical protein